MRSWAAAGFLVLVSLVVYLSTGLLHVTPDTVPARYLPVSFLREGHFYLDPFPEVIEGEPYYVKRVEGRHISRYSVVPALFAAPIYAPVVWSGSELTPRKLAGLEKLSAAILTSLSVGLVFLAVRRAASARLAWFATLAYAFGSGSFGTSSHGLWQHGPGQLMLAAALLCLVSGRVGLAGFPLGWAIVIRPPNLLLAAALAGYVAFHQRRQLLPFLLAGLPAVGFQLWYNATYVGGPLTFTVGPNGEGWEEWSTPLWTGLSGLLFSPGRGLFLYSPVFALSVAGMAMSFRKGGDPLIRWLSLGSLLLLLVASKFIIWWGGDCFGPRYLAELGPFLAYSLVPLQARLARSLALRVVAALLLAWSIAANALGAYSEDAWKWSEDRNVNEHRERLWNWTDNPLAIPLVTAFNRAVMLVEGQPTSREAPYLLKASYHDAHIRRFEDRLELEVLVSNDGGAVWLTRGQPYGRIWLGWRYYRAGLSERVLEGRVSLGRELFPGESYRITTSIPLPSESETYRLEVGMVSESVAWFPGPLWFEVDPSLRIQIGPTSVGR